MADGGVPLGDVRTGLCVPRSCGPAALEAALRESLRHQHPRVHAEVRPEYCHTPGERGARGGGPGGPQGGNQTTSTAASLFW